MIPGGGWLAAFANVDMPGKVFMEPVVAWVLKDGGVAGLVVDLRTRRTLRDASEYAEFVGFLLPDDTEALEDLEACASEVAQTLRKERGLPQVAVESPLEP